MISLVNDLFELTIAPDQTITQNQMVALNKSLDAKKMELIQLLNKASSDSNLINRYIEMKLKSIDCVFEINDDLCNDCNEYIQSHSQEDICFQKQNEIDTSIVNYYAEKISKSSNQRNDSSDNKNENLGDVDNIVGTSDEERITNAKNIINNYSGDLKKLKQTLLELIDKYPFIFDFINKKMGE